MVTVAPYAVSPARRGLHAASVQQPSLVILDSGRGAVSGPFYGDGLAVRAPALRQPDDLIWSSACCLVKRMEFAAMRESARAVRARYAAMEDRRYGRRWTAEEIMLGFVGDVGDLAKLVQGKAGVRPTAALDEQVAHELADCLWCVLTLADEYGLDLEQAFSETMETLTRHLDGSDGED